MKNVLSLSRLERGVYEGTLAGKQAIVAFTARNRKAADSLAQPTRFNPKRIQKAKTIGAARGWPVYVATQILLRGKPQFSYAVPLSLWPKVKTGTSDFPVNPKAKTQYEKEDAVLSGFSVELATTVAPAKATKAGGTVRRKAPPGKVTEIRSREPATFSVSLATEDIAKHAVAAMGSYSYIPVQPREEMYGKVKEAVGGDADRANAVMAALGVLTITPPMSREALLEKVEGGVREGVRIGFRP